MKKTMISKSRALATIADWLITEYRPNLFISIQMPFETKTDSIEDFRHKLWLITKWTEKNLLGRYWFSKPYRFFGVCERGRDGTWHAHILLSCTDRDISEIEIAFAVAGERYMETRHTDKAPNIDIREIVDAAGVMGYCSKQLGTGRITCIKSDRLFTSETLFNRYSSRWSNPPLESLKQRNIRAYTQDLLNAAME